MKQTEFVSGGKSYQQLNDPIDHEQAEEQIRKLLRAIEQSPATVVITDINGRIEYVNPKFTELTGYTPEEALGQNPSVLKSGETPPEEYKRLWQTIRSGNVWRGEFLNKKKNGELYWESASISPVKNSKGVITHFVAVKEDITERKRVEEEIRQLNRDLELRAAELDAANKELETFAYSVSHDLRAPLRHIDGFSSVLLEDYSEKLDEQGKEYLQFIRQGSQRMAQLIDDMLRLSRVTRGEMHLERVDLSEIAQEIVEQLSRDEPAREVEFIIAPALEAYGDARLLRTVLDNLLGNAWKFTSKRSRTEIEFGADTRDGKPAYFVRDNGAGFDMAYAEKLFGTFQRLHSEDEFPGTGIGLATVQRIIRRHRGHIWAEGEVGKGATFYFTLG